ncbi:MAG: PTS sugar transporter subunit IIA [Phycisphaeraceae bacterium]|nr:PTS sugar transporter subunit IIA [Phycisphaeraceae bacterium]
MLLSNILQAPCVKVPLDSTEKNAAISELIDILDANGLLQDKDLVSDAVFTRERTRSTGIGSGIAIPHGKCTAVSELVMALGITPGIDFDSIDGHPVNIIILLVSPTDQTGTHIQALAGISRLMLDSEFKQSLEQATSPEQAYKLLQDKENE